MNFKETFFFFKKRGVAVKDLAIFTRQFAVLLNSGIPMAAAMNVMINQTKNPRLKESAEKIKTYVGKHGLKISQALEKDPDIFSPLYRATIRCGEQTGNLSNALNELADNLEREAQMRARYSAALIYPAATMIVSIISIIVIMVFVFPGFLNIFNSLGLKLPWPTRVLLFISNALCAWWVWVLIIAAAVWAVSYCRNPKNKKTRDNILAHVPFLNNAINKMILARFCRTFQLLYANGYPVISSLKLLEDIVDNEVFEKKIRRIAGRVTEGDSVAEAMAKDPDFSRTITGMLAAGEESGNLSGMLSKTASYYEFEVDQFLTSVNALIEPVIMAVLGVIIGFILLALILPLYGIIGVFEV